MLWQLPAKSDYRPVRHRQFCKITGQQSDTIQAQNRQYFDDFGVPRRYRPDELAAPCTEQTPSAQQFTLTRNASLSHFCNR
jgi:hypothetical protein